MSYATSLAYQPWAITPAGAAAVLKVLARVESITLPKSIAKRPTEDYYGQPIEQMRIEKNVAIIPMKGPLMKSAEPVFKLFGVISHDDVADDLKAAKAAGVERIILDVDSPGGSVVGTPELASLVAEISSGTFTAAHTSLLMASAAIYSTAAASYITAAPSAIVGSVGVVATHLDASRLFSDMGVEFEQFKSGDYKGMGHPGIPLTDKQREFLQNDVLEQSEQFKAYMRKHRDIDSDDMQGQWFTGSHAKDKGFVDDNFATLGDLLDVIR